MSANGAKYKSRGKRVCPVRRPEKGA